MKIYKNENDNDSEELFICQIKMRERADMHISPQMLYDDNVKQPLLHMIFNNAVEVGAIEPETIMQQIFTVGIEIDPENEAVNFHILKNDDAQTKSFAEFLLERILETLDEEIKNDNAENEIDDENTPDDEDIKITVVAEYTDINTVINTCKLIGERPSLCNLNESALFIPEDRKSNRMIHLATNKDKYEWLMTTLYEFSSPVNEIKAYATDDSIYRTLRSRCEEHYKTINDLTEIAKI